jgi:hypothetical protein
MPPKLLVHNLKHRDHRLDAPDAHAGWPKGKKEPEHVYLNVVGGFLEGEVRRAEGVATLRFRHHSVDGKILNVDVLAAK